MYKMIFSDLDETLLFNHHVSKVNCESIKKARKNGIKFVPTTGRPINMIQEILGYFRILAPAVLIVMIGIDLITAVMSMEYMPGKDDSIRKAVSKISLRIIAAILLFFVPTIITIVMNLDGVKQKVVVDSSCMDLY